MNLERHSTEVHNAMQSMKSHQIFSALSDEELEDLCSAAEHVEFKQGEVIIKEEQPNHFLYLLYDGKVHVKSYGITIRSMSRNGLIGEISVAGLGSASDDSATAEVVAATDGSAIRFPVSVVKALADKKQEFAESLHDAAMARLLS